MRRNNILIFLLIIVLAIPAFFVLFHTELFSMHDNAQVQRVYEVHKALVDGMFPVRWSQDLGYGYGYPMFNFYAPLIYYLGAAMYALGFSAILSVKIVLVFGMLLSGIGMFLLAKKIWNIPAGLVAATLYMYFPYHALDIYVRGDFTEAFAYSLLPLLFYTVLRLSETLRWKVLIFASLCYAAIIVSHNLTAFMISPFLLLFCLYLVFSEKQNTKKRTYYLAAMLMLGILVAAFYWLPALAEIHYTNVGSVLKGGSDFHVNFVCPFQLWDSPWMYGGSAPGCIDGLSFRIGKLHIIFSLAAVVIGFVVLFYNKQSEKKLHILWQMGGIFFGLLFATYMTIPVSLSVWDSLPFLVYFQFPWRFLLLVGFFSSLAGGLLVVFLQSMLKKSNYTKQTVVIAAAVIICLTVGFYSKLFIPQFKYYLPDQYYVSHQNLTWSASKDSDEYLPLSVKKPTSKKEALAYHPLTSETAIFVKNLVQKTNFFQATILTPVSQPLILHIAPFPAWHTYIDGKEVQYAPVSGGIQIHVPQGLHQIEAVFQQTGVEIFADLLSLTGVLILCAGILWEGYERKNT